MKNIIITVILLTFAIIFDVYYEVNYTFVNYTNLESLKPLPEGGIKILQISDYHDYKQYNKAAKALEGLEPDIVVITGDLVDRSTKNLDNVYNFIEEVVKIAPNVYFVNGNHEWASRKVKELLSGLSKRKVTALNNENTVLEIRGVKVNICGIDDTYSRHGDVNKALKGIDKNLYTILLSHSPDIVNRHADLPVDLILSGHTHGGQVRLPFIGAVIAPGQGFFPKYSKGLYSINEGATILYIDSGLGTSAMPVRFLNRSQVSFITVAFTPVHM